MAATTTVPFVAHEGIRETVNYECDVRRSLATLASEFPRIDFETAVGFVRPDDSTVAFTDASDDEVDVDTDDPIWNAYRQRFGMDYAAPCESAELHVVARRGSRFFQWLVQHYNNVNDTTKKATDVIVCTHSAFLRCILSWNQVGGVPQQMAQTLDDRTDKTNDPPRLFEYCPTLKSSRTRSDQATATGEGEAGLPPPPAVVSAFEASMRRDYENCELRSFCLVQRR